MANKLKEEDLVLNIIVNGNKAQSEIGKVSRALQDSVSKSKSLEAEQKKLEKQGLTNTRRYKELTQEIEKNNAVVQQQKKRLEELNQTLSLEDKTMSQLKKSLQNLRRLRDQTAPNTEQWKQYSEQIRAVSSRIDDLRNRSERASGVLSKLGGSLKAFFNSALGGIATFAAVIAGVKKATDTFAEFDDKVADVMKTTGRTKEEIMSLNAELEKLDTRTSQNDLLGLARAGGKLGITDVNELRGFVEATNQLVVALNEDLGGDVEGTINAVGKLVDIFQVDDLFGYEQGLLKVGSAINELGAASTANEANMVDFARRMAGVAPLADITISQILGLGATLDQLGQTSEVSSTALSKLFLQMSKDSEKFSKYAQIPVKEFKELLEKDFMAAFVKVLEGVKSNANGINELAQTLGDLGVDGGRVVAVLGSLANNTHILTNQMDLANDAFEKGASLTQEYNVKNSTAAAQLEKTRKEVTKYWRELGERLWPVMSSVNSLAVIFIRLLSEIVRFVSENLRTIILLTSTIAAYTIAINAATIATRAKTVAIRVATAAQWVFNAAISANPIGLFVAALTAAVGTIYLYKKRLSEAEIVQKSFNEIKKQAAKDTATEIELINRHVKLLEMATSTREAQNKAINSLREMMPEVLAQYTDEEIRAGKATVAIQNQTKAILAQAEAAATRAKIEELAAKKRAIIDGDLGFFERLYRTAKGVVLGPTATQLNLKEDIQDIVNLDAAMDRLVATLQKANTEINNFSVPNAEDYSFNSGGKSDKELEREGREREKARKLELEQALKSYQEQLKAEGLFRRNLKELTASELEQLIEIQKSYQNKTDEINKKYQHALTETTNAAEEELTRRLLAERKYRDLLLDPRDPKLIQEKEQHEARLKQAGLFGLKLEEMTEEQKKALERLEAIHAANIGKIDAELMQKEIQRRQSAYQSELADLRIKNNEELAEIRTLEEAKIRLSETLSSEALQTIRTLEQAKKILRSQYQLEEEALTRQHLESLNNLILQVLDSGQWDSLNLSDAILSDDEKKILEDKLREIKEQLAKLKGNNLADNAEADANKERDSRDILGMTAKDWDVFFENIAKGKIQVEDLAGAFKAATQVWAQYNAFVAAGEERQLQKFEEATRRRREELDKRLKDGRISQENYNKQIEKLETDLNKKRAKMEHEQAKRDRNIALMTAIVNTASGVTRALKDFVFPYSSIVAGIVGAMGALQIGTIMRTPLPSVVGREEGGYLVRRSQDGKVFNAQHDPDRRGYVGKPTVIVGENGTEFVANAEAVSNPNIRPILDIIDTAQRNGTISTLTLEGIIPRSRELRASIPGRQYGGSISNSQSQSTITAYEAADIKSALDKVISVVEKLDKNISKGIKAEVSLLGKGGLYDAEEEYNNITENTSL